MRHDILERFRITGRGTAIVLATATSLPTGIRVQGLVHRPDGTFLSVVAFKELLLRTTPRPHENEVFLLSDVDKDEVPTGSSIEFIGDDSDASGLP